MRSGTNWYQIGKKTCYSKCYVEKVNLLTDLTVSSFVYKCILRSKHNAKEQHHGIEF